MSTADEAPNGTRDATALLLTEQSSIETSMPTVTAASVSVESDANGSVVSHQHQTLEKQCKEQLVPGSSDLDPSGEDKQAESAGVPALFNQLSGRPVRRPAGAKRAILAKDSSLQHSAEEGEHGDDKEDGVGRRHSDAAMQVHPPEVLLLKEADTCQHSCTRGRRHTFVERASNR